MDLLKKMEPSGKRPKPSKEPTEYMGARIYYDTTNERLRVYARGKGDRREQNFNIDFSDAKSAKSQYSLACAFIEAIRQRDAKKK